ncbi:5-formyltetrahydrofolate cyclo-ligase [Snodgrassella alvi]|jgi:5-formyltetrahydrofolate cyclo-ligase|uniref:5-formyltetrahydrofolate cyclo-ligase n=1 Tax=Snodgrassella alvi TaxID=1196083 RepID=UPI000C1EE841|nr:5-formyltetrahydrofolate cyclo-ligase [Snodgrassella alvi]PIT51224.1 5-formyltetrahydrofolate cyclo-ligase [Snodgrassella alvi]
MTTYSDKQQLRRLLRQRRKALSQESRRLATKKINRLLYPFIRRQKRIAVYWAVGSELSLWSFIVTAQKRGAQVYLPYIESKKRQLWFTPCPRLPRRHATIRYLNLHHQNTGKHKIPQFNGCKIRARYLHTVLIPLLGIDHQGNRLGQGGGYYDATLANFRYLQPLLVGVGFSCQQVDTIKSESHDINIPIFVSENGYQYLNR